MMSRKENVIQIVPQPRKGRNNKMNKQPTNETKGKSDICYVTLSLVSIIPK